MERWAVFIFSISNPYVFNRSGGITAIKNVWARFYNSGLIIIGNVITFFFMIANQETLAALVQFFNTAFTSGESDGSFGDLSALPEESATDFYSPQPDVSSNAHKGASAV